MNFLTGPTYEIITPIHRNEILKNIEKVARTCYKSEDKITEGSASKMIKALVKSQHWAMLEHASITVKLVTDRGTSHELVRHREASYAQESTRYCRYNSEAGICCIVPEHIDVFSEEFNEWADAIEVCEKFYIRELEHYGRGAQDARAILPTCLKTEINITANLREWYHIFNLRVLGTTGLPHPEIRRTLEPVLKEFAEALPEVFGQQWEDYNNGR